MTILPSVWTRFQKLCTESGFSASSRVEKMMRAFLLKNDD